MLKLRVLQIVFHLLLRVLKLLEGQGLSLHPQVEQAEPGLLKEIKGRGQGHVLPEEGLNLDGGEIEGPDLGVVPGQEGGQGQGLEGQGHAEDQGLGITGEGVLDQEVGGLGLGLRRGVGQSQG